jgi:hypothetical protein
MFRKAEDFPEQGPCALIAHAELYAPPKRRRSLPVNMGVLFIGE